MKIFFYLKKLLLLLTGVLLGMLIASYLFFTLSSSDDTVSSQRVHTSSPEKIYVEYVAYACGDCYPRLTEIYRNKEGKEVLAKHPLFTHYPDDIDNPETTTLAVSGNRFMLTAYREVEMTVNRQHQNNQHLTNHIYITQWQAIPPFTHQRKKLTKALSQIKQVSHSQEDFW